MQFKQIKFLIGLMLLTLGMCLSACDKEKKKPQHDHVVVAKLQTPVQRLYYSSTLSPISTTPVVAPVAGNVEKMFFSYGEKVPQGKKLLVINSHPLSQEYRKTVSDFLQKKQAYVTGKLSFAGTQALFNAGVIPRSQYSSEQTQFNNAALDFLQARYQLRKVLRTANMDPSHIEQLSISDTTKVNALLQRHFSHIVVNAPIEGVALYPTSKTGSSAKALSVGSTLKNNQVLLLIGDLSGLSAKFQVSEIDIDRIVKNMVVKVTSNAFPMIKLQGYVTSVSSQAAQNSNDSGLSMFNVSVKIPHLSDAAAKKIRVGMTAKFEIDIKSQKQIMLPVAAVFQKNGLSMVTVIDKDGIKKAVPVVTGNTTPSSVAIRSGIKPGDRVVIHD